MVFIAIGLISLIYSAFITLATVLVALYRLQHDRLVFKFSFNKPLILSIVGALLICYGVTTL